MSKPDGLALGRGLSLDELIGQIDTRLAALRPLAVEYQQLESARAVLVADYSTGSASPRAARSPARQAAQSRRRAPRGANREAILRLARERPGISVSEIAEATRIGKPTIHSTVYALKRRGILDATSDGVKLAGEPTRAAPSPQSRTRPSRRSASRRARTRARTAARRRAPIRPRARNTTAARAASPSPADANAGAANNVPTTDNDSASTE